MNAPTLVVSSPPHDEVDLEAVAQLLRLDVFAARLKATFTAPEILGAAGPNEAVQQAVALRKSGMKVTILPGASLAGLPWPDPATHLDMDDHALRATVGGAAIEIEYDRDVLGVLCQPPEEFSFERPIDLVQAKASGHGPTIAEAMQSRGFIDLYVASEDGPRRVSIVPEVFGVGYGALVSDLTRRFKALRLDRRLEGVRPRVRSREHEHGHDPEHRVGPDPSKRKGFSFGTTRLSELLGVIAPELRDAPYFELGSRIAYALAPPEAPDALD